MKRKPPDRTEPGKAGFGRSSFARKPPGASNSSFKSKPKAALKSGPSDHREAVKRATINALKRAKRAADKAGIALSEWEGEFLGSVEERVKTYGRAFGDPDKGAPGQALSMMQAVKLKEITAKANGEKRTFPKRRGRKDAPPED